MFSVFVYFVAITFTWLIPASIMYEVWNACKKGSTAALSMGYSIAGLILLQYSLRILLLDNTSALRSTCIQ